MVVSKKNKRLKISLKKYIIIVAVLAIFCNGLYSENREYYYECGWLLSYHLPAVKLYKIDLTTGEYYLGLEFCWENYKIDFYYLVKKDIILN